jgi:hypothetical protein
MDRWEYRREAVRLTAEPQDDGYQETPVVLTERVASTWLDRLNDLGGEGWELIYERAEVLGGDPVSMIYYGTLKRRVE